jgi:hypothetical protein
MAHRIITAQEAADAAKRVREIRERGNIRDHYSYVNYDELIDLEIILQDYRHPDLMDPSQFRDEYKEEYEYVHRLATMFYHEEEAHAGLL